MQKTIRSLPLTALLITHCFFLITSTCCAYNIPENFGKTHFITGLKHYPELIDKKQQDNPRSHIQCAALFSPNQVVFDTLCELITNEQSKICIAVYTLTDVRIAKELVKAKQRGVHVEIITDRSSPLDRSTKIGLLHANNIPIFLYQPPLENNVQKGLMHNKFALFFNNGPMHEKVIWHGSFNFSYSGYRHNCESILILRESSIFQQFESEFKQIKGKSTRYQPQSNV